MSHALVIFISLAGFFTIAVAYGVVRLLYEHFREQWIRRRNLRQFAATLPESERAGFWRLLKQRRIV